MAKITEQNTTDADHEDDGYTRIEASGRVHVSRRHSAMTPRSNGMLVAVCPSDEIVEAMRSRGWTKVKAEWLFKEDRVAGLCLKQADGGGVSIRYGYPSQRPHIMINARRVGRAVLEGDPSCEGREKGDEFWFTLPAGLRFDPP
jgi:hypothetical protein